MNYEKNREFKEQRNLLTYEINRSLWSQWPSGSDNGPRDSRLLGKTNDWLYLFRVVAWRRRGYNRIVYFKNGTSPIYLVMDQQGQYRHPMSGNAVLPGENWVYSGMTKMNTLIKQLHSFWFFRLLGARLGTENADYSLMVDGIQVSQDGIVAVENVQRISMRWGDWAVGSIDHDKAQFRENILNLEGGNEFLPIPPITAKDWVLCPFDGPVRFIVGEMSTPAWSWQEMCGRKDVYAVCPKCLGVFATTLYSIN